MFKSWKVGQTGWVRLRNGKVARAVQFSDGSLPVQIQYVVGQILAMHWVDNSGSLLGGKSDYEPIAHLPDCTGFDWECVVDPVSSRCCERGTKCCTVAHDKPKTHVWKVGDWFVVDKKHHNDPVLHWGLGMDRFVGLPIIFERWTEDGNLKSNGWSWHPSWCRPCEPPKADSKDEADFWPFPDYAVGDYVIMPTKPSDPFLQGHSWSSDLDSIIGIPLLVRRVFPVKLEIDLTHGCILVCKSWVQPCDMGSVEYVTNWSWATHG